MLPVRDRKAILSRWYLTLSADFFERDIDLGGDECFGEFFEFVGGYA